MPPSSPTAETTTASPANSGSRDSNPGPRRQRSWLAEFLFTPFQDIDERVRVKHKR